MVGWVVISVLFLAAIAAGVAWFARTLRAELAALRSESQAELASRNAEVDRRLHGLHETLDRRLESTTQATHALHARLGKVDEATAQMLERAKELGQLQQMLRPPKARGGFGELLLENLLRDRLPPAAFETQHSFRSGERVDAVIKVDRLVPIDSKFPFDNFERLATAQTDVERQQHERAFARDVKGHIEAIATKYIRPEEGTYDFAFMYFASEAVYYELACGRTGALLAYAHDRRVFPVSPTTLTAYLQVVALGLKGMQIEEDAREVMAYVADLNRDFAAFKEDFSVVGKHLSHAQGRFAEAERRLDRFDAKLERATEDRSAGELPRALDAA
jgi:DNA recombination protein RmuC